MSDRVQLKTTPAKITTSGDVWVLHLPRFGEEGTHYHSYGLLTPYFKGLTQGRLMATACVNKRCPISKGRGEKWLPPRADCRPWSAPPRTTTTARTRSPGRRRWWPRSRPGNAGPSKFGPR